jgi:tetratricopeptide (TPR) repeat protein
MPDDEPLAAGGPVVNEENPWPGLSAFVEENAHFFHGRDDETAGLLQMVRRRVLTVFLGQSGLGKTSLLQAGLFPQLRQEDFLPVLVRLDYSEDAPDLVAQTRETVKQACARARIDAPEFVPGETLWEYWHREDNDFWSERNRLVMPVLVFDQFEEIFTLGASRPQAQERIAQLLTQLGDLIENRAPEDLLTRRAGANDQPFDYRRVNCKVIFSLREDFLASLESLKSQVPSLVTNRFRLEKMNGRQAFDAVQEAGGRLVDSEISRKIVAFVASDEEAPDVPEADLPRLEIEPTLLSVFCRELNNKRLLSGAPKITTDHLVGSKDAILSEFYQRSLDGFGPDVQDFIEEKLLTTSGYRNNIALEDIPRLGPGGNAIQTLIDRRLLRLEYTSRLPRVELTHDVLTEVIKKSRDRRREEKLTLEMARQREEADKALQLKEEELRETKRRNAILLGACIAVIIFGAISFWEYLKAQQATKETEASLAAADQLIDFMQGNLRDELEPVGQLKALDATAAKILDYQTNLSQDANTPARQAKQAVALNFQGDVYLSEGNIGAAQADYEKGLALLQNLERQDGTSRELKDDLVLSNYEMGSVYFVQDTADRLNQALKYLQQGAAFAPDLPFDPANDRENRIFGQLYNLFGAVYKDKGDFKQALANDELARQRIAALIAHAPDKSKGLYEQAVNEHQEGDALFDENEHPKAWADYQASVTTLQGLLKADPSDARSSYQLATVYGSMGEQHHADNDEKPAIASFQQAIPILERLVAQDAENKEWLHGLSVLYEQQGESLFSLAHSENDYAAAMASYQQSLVRAQDLVKLDNKSARWQQSLALAERGVGSVLVMENNFKAALPYYKDGLAIFQKFLNKSFDDADNHGDVAYNSSLIGDIYYAESVFDQADAAYQVALDSRKSATDLNPTNAMHHNEYAWELATCPSPRKRNGALALKEATLSEQLQLAGGSPDPRIDDTLAAAQAEAGKYADAAASEKRALALIGTSGIDEIASMTARLKLYEANKPYHRASPKDAFF